MDWDDYLRGPPTFTLPMLAAGVSSHHFRLAKIPGSAHSPQYVARRARAVRWR